METGGFVERQTGSLSIFSYGLIIGLQQLQVSGCEEMLLEELCNLSFNRGLNTRVVPLLASIL